MDLAGEIDAYLDGGCGDEQQQKCLANSGEHLHLLCAQCERREYEPHPYIAQLYQLYLLQEAHFPLDAEACALDTWHDLAILRSRIMARAYDVKKKG